MLWVSPQEWNGGTKPSTALSHLRIKPMALAALLYCLRVQNDCGVTDAGIVVKNWNDKRYHKRLHAVVKKNRPNLEMLHRRKITRLGCVRQGREKSQRWVSHLRKRDKGIIHQWQTTILCFLYAGRFVSEWKLNNEKNNLTAQTRFTLIMLNVQHIKYNSIKNWSNLHPNWICSVTQWE